MTSKADKLNEILANSTDGKKIFGTSFCIKSNALDWSGASGNLNENSQYFIASTTKLFITAIVLKLRAESKLQLDDKIVQFFPPESLKGLHILNNHDYTSEITIRQLLAHTSGLPDYFQGKDSDGNSLEKTVVNGIDQTWSFDEVLVRCKSLKPLFVPGSSGKANYSDVNFQLLGRIIEVITGKSFAETCRIDVIEPLGLNNTYLYEDAGDKRPANLYFQAKPLIIPRAMTSFWADGGIVSTSQDMMRFIQAFMQGELFPVENINEMKIWNRIFFPMQSGIGMHRFKLWWIFNPFGSVPELIGHSGLSGALAFYAPEKKLYITGTVNQVAYPDTSFRLAIKLILQALK
jgi:D-alanyl-D-alanine carboxypeptidase